MNKKNKRLVLKSDTVAVLRNGDLLSVAGGLIPTGSPTGFCHTNDRACGTGGCSVGCSAGCSAGCPQATATTCPL